MLDNECVNLIISKCSYIYIIHIEYIFNYLSIKVKKTIKPECITEHSLDLNLFCISHD